MKEREIRRKELNLPSIPLTVELRPVKKLSPRKKSQKINLRTHASTSMLIESDEEDKFVTKGPAERSK